MKRWLWIIIFCCALSISVEGKMPVEFSYEIPVLVISDNSVGQCLKVPFMLSNSSNDTPLRIMIADDTPAGSGASIRSSVWLAAITAAMQRNNVMNGVRITVEFSGDVDGPSAGAMLCLSIISALDERNFPTDFAMTGTIMPDGTIGLVGGVAQKLKAAASSGIKRVCIPAFQRFEEQEDGSRIDLFREGEKLGLKLYPVENINDAYAVLHDLPKLQTTHFNERDICAIPKAAEDILIKQYNRYHQQIVNYIRQVPQKTLEEIQNDPFSAPIFSTTKAEQAFQAGRLLNATDMIADVWAAWQARAENEFFFAAFVKKYPTHTLQEAVVTLQGIIQEYYNKMEFPNEYIPDSKTMTEISAQLEPIDTLSTCLGVKLALDLNTPSSDEVKQLSDEELNLALNLEGIKLLMFNAIPKSITIDNATRPELAMTMPQIKANKQIAKVERLFYSAWRAVDVAIEADFLNPYCKSENILPNDIIQYLAQNDIYFSIYLMRGREALILHQRLSQSQTLKDPQYQTVATICSNIDVFAQACALLTKYSQDIDLSYLIRAARTQALLNIQECKELNIPCLGSISDFEYAEIHRDDAEADKVNDILIPYWRASLNAKALVMGFKQ